MSILVLGAAGVVHWGRAIDGTHIKCHNVFDVDGHPEVATAMPVIHSGTGS
jgi:hypothetical protein